MIKKYLTVLTVFLVLFSFGIAGADQTGGLVSGTGSPFPVVDNGVGGTSNLEAYVNPQGIGQALIYGYYNVRNNKTNYFQIVNTNKSNGVVVKVRFREAATIANGCGAGVDCGSLEVLDFIVCLSKGDVWTAKIVGTGTGPARIVKLDTDTATGPNIPAAGQPFATQVTPNITISNDLTKEGYFEVLAYGRWNGLTCSVLGNADNTSAGFGNFLMGTNFIVDEDTGQTFNYQATAIADWNPREVTPQTTGNEDFNLESGTSADATLWGTSLFQVNYILSKAQVFGTYVIDPALSAETSMVITFPTKILSQRNGLTLFDSPDVVFTIFDTAERKLKPKVGFSPRFVPGNQLPHEVNVLNMYNNTNTKDGIFTSKVFGDLNAQGFNLGWVEVDMTTSSNCAPASPFNTVSCSKYGGLIAGGAGAGTVVSSRGLPAVGYVFQERDGAQQSYNVSYKEDIR